MWFINAIHLSSSNKPSVVSMNNSKAQGNTWRRVLIVALLPLTIIFWMTGWAFYWLGDQQTLTSAARKETVTCFKKENWKQNRGRKEYPQPIFT
jgi:Tfp pilus assembly protein PilO